MSNLVSTEWLAAHLQEVRLVDASWYMPDEKRDPRTSSRPGIFPARYFSTWTVIADHTTDLPHTMPPPGEFSAAVSKLGIGDGEMVVVYDGTGIFSAPRVMVDAEGDGA